MTRKTRYFVLGAGAVLVIGLGGGLLAYLAYQRVAGVPAGLPAELRYVPTNVAVVAFADVQSVMNSDLRRALVPNNIDPESRKGRQLMNDFAGVDLEKQVNRVVAFVEPSSDPDPQAQSGSEMPRALVLVQGTFDTARVEAFIRERGGTMDDYKGRKIYAGGHDGHDVAVGLIAPDLIALGQADMVRKTIDASQDSSISAGNITANPDMMTLIRDNAGSTAWAVGQFDEISRRMRIPSGVTAQVPPVRHVSIKANINGGVKATIRAETADKAAADQLRDVVRGFISLARLQSGEKNELETLLKTIELSSSDSTVRMSFSVSSETVRQIAPRPGARRNPPLPPPAK